MKKQQIEKLSPRVGLLKDLTDFLILIFRIIPIKFTVVVTEKPRFEIKSQKSQLHRQSSIELRLSTYESVFHSSDAM